MRLTVGLAVCAMIASTVIPSVSVRADDRPLRAYVGTYTGPKSKGIYVVDFDPGTGKCSEPRVAAEVANPSFVAIHPSQKFLYVVSETDSFNGQKGGGVSAYAINADGSLALLNQQTSGGAGPCFVGIDAAGKVAMVANYGSGSFESLPIGADGKLGAPASFIQDQGKGIDPKRQEGPHAHSINPDPAGQYAFACDLGLDKVFSFHIDAATAKLTANEPPYATVPPGSGPRHLVFHPSGKFVYVINEMGNSVTAFAYDGDKGALRELETVSTLPQGVAVPNNTCAEVQVHPNGKFLYGSNRGDDSIAVFAINPGTGKLTFQATTKSGGKTPRNFRLTPDGKWLWAAHQASDNVVLFKVDGETGTLAPAGTELSISAPVCVKFVPTP